MCACKNGTVGASPETTKNRCRCNGEAGELNLYIAELSEIPLVCRLRSPGGLGSNTHFALPRVFQPSRNVYLENIRPVRVELICSPDATMSSPLAARQVMEYPAHDLPVTGLAFAPGDTGVALGGFDLLAGSADYKITLFKTQGRCHGDRLHVDVSGSVTHLSLCRIPSSWQQFKIGVKFFTGRHISMRAGAYAFFFAPEPELCPLL